METIEDRDIPNSTDVDDDDMEIDEEDPSPLLHEADDDDMEINEEFPSPLLRKEELPNEREDEIDSLIDEASEDGDAQGLFVDLGVLGLELDDDACRDLMEDEM